MTSSSLDQLNPQQLAAVTLPPESALILAGAGSGKTRVLISRITWLLQTGQISPANVLAVTFTNKAAKEMMLRLSTQLTFNLRDMWIGTFHGLCHKFLRLHSQLANLPSGFQILDSQDQLSAIKRLLKTLNIDRDDEQLAAKKIAWFISAAKENGDRAEKLIAKDPITRKKIEIYQAYEQQCQREGVVDFGELILRTYELLRDNQMLRLHYQQRFEHILIDEFQDTNKLQYLWLKLFAGLGEKQQCNVFAVGDDDQSIYAFRGARVGNMADFLREFKVQHQIKLEQNYRSHSNILDCANALIANNQNRLGKNLHTDAGAGEPVRIYQGERDFDETDWIVDEIKALLNEGYNHSQIALLYRSNAQSRIIESSLFQARIPYRVYGGLRFFERAEIKNALAYLRLLENINDDTSLLRVVNFPPRGIGSRSIEKLQDLATMQQSSMIGAIGFMEGRAATLLQQFSDNINMLKQRCSNLSLKESIALVLEETGLLAHYLADKDSADRVENLHELVNAGESFVPPPTSALTDNQLNQLSSELEVNPSQSVLASFLSHASLEAGDYQADVGSEMVQLMTVHAAKGLEFDVVFITGLEERLFPHEQANFEPKGLEEERRLMYVAITRARKRLYLSYVQQRLLNGQTRYNTRSRFIDELPQHCIKWLTVGKKSYFNGYGDTYKMPANKTYFKEASIKPDNSKNSSVNYNSPKSTVVTEAGKLQQGSKVFHTKFGEGKILAIEGQGESAKAQVSFKRHGTKWLALSIAKLTLVED